MQRFLDKKLRYQILESVNNGISKSLISFDDNSEQLKKAKPSYGNLKKFSFGDYVYKDAKIGYNNYIGEKVAICVSDEPRKELYVVLGHVLLTQHFPWANKNTNLFNNKTVNLKNGWLNTLNILNNYKTELSGTIWSYLGKDEYIPSINESITIYNNCKGTDVWDEIGFATDSFWTSSLFNMPHIYTMATGVSFYLGSDGYDIKTSSYRSIALLHIK